MITPYSDEYWMKFAIEQATLAAAQEEVPVGAIVVSGNKIIGAGFNTLIGSHDPTAHAEIQAIRSACIHIQNYRLPEDSTLYVTLEPCTMCVGALIHARVKRVVFGATESKAGSLISARKLLDSGYYNHLFEFTEGCLKQQCSQQLSDFFKMRRKQKKQEKISIQGLNQPME